MTYLTCSLAEGHFVVTTDLVFKLDQVILNFWAEPLLLISIEIV